MIDSLDWDPDRLRKVLDDARVHDTIENLLKDEVPQSLLPEVEHGRQEDPDDDGRDDLLPEDDQVIRVDVDQDEGPDGVEPVQEVEVDDGGREEGRAGQQVGPDCVRRLRVQEFDLPED